MQNGYTQIGNGARCVMVLHGWFGDSQIFSGIFPYLNSEEYSYVFMDYRGYGKSMHRKGDYTMAEISADVVALADSLGWQQFHLVGHSMGGMAIQRVAVDARDRILSCTAVTPVPACGLPFGEEEWGLFMGAAGSDEMRAMIANHSVSNRLPATWTAATVKHSRDTSLEEAYAAYARAFIKTDFAEHVKGLTVPVHVMIGEHDPNLNLEFMTQTFMQWYPNASLEVLPNSGHYPMQEIPLFFVSQLEKYLCSVTSR